MPPFESRSDRIALLTLFRFGAFQHHTPTEAKRFPMRCQPSDGQKRRHEILNLALVLNPRALPPNHEPFVTQVIPASPRAYWGDEILIQLTVNNEPEETYFIEWSVDGGELSWNRSTIPQVRWAAPRAVALRRVHVQNT